MCQINARTKLVTLLGHPVGHSLSPVIHNKAFEAVGLNYVYVAVDVRPDSLKEAVSGLRALGIAGSNVTIPHKQAVIPFLDFLTRSAEAMGSVNTLFLDTNENGDQVLGGDNTDAEGFAAPLLAFSERLRACEVLIWGAGGAARAAIHAMHEHFSPQCIYIAARNTEKAATLLSGFQRADLRSRLIPVPLEAALTYVRRSTLLVNTTPIGMYPRTDETICPATDVITSDHLVYDIVYNPPVTRLLKEAASRGATTIDGQEMFIGQAAASFFRWTNHEMPLDVVRKALTQWREGVQVL